MLRLTRSGRLIQRGLLMAGLAIVLASQALAAASSLTPAGTLIRNQAAATFTGAAGVLQTALSNEVITTVLAVYGVTVTPNGADGSGTAVNASPGSVVYVPYVLTNTGNEVDKYTLTLLLGTSNTFTPQSAAVYIDTNGNGTVDPGDTLVASGINSGGISTAFAADEQVSLIVTYLVPSTATAGQKASVDIKAVSVGDTSKVDQTNFNTATVLNNAILTVFKSVTPREVAAGDTVTYTVAGSNTGSAGARGQDFTNMKINGTSSTRTGILVRDALPTGQQFNAQVGTVAPDGGYIVYKRSGGGYTNTLADSDVISPVTEFALFVEASPVTATVLSPGQAFQFRYTVQVASTLARGTYQNVAIAQFDDSTGAAQPEVSSNPCLLVVGGGDNQTAKAALGPDGNPDAAELTAADRSTSAANRPAGSTVTYTVTVENDGNGSDTFDFLTVSNAVTVTGSAVQFFRADGVTPQPDSDSDGIPDSGSLAAGAQTDLVVKVFIPAGHHTTTSNYDIQIRARSSVDSSKTNDTVLRIAGVLGASLALGNRDGAAGTVSTALVTKNSSPGNCADFPLDVVNLGGSPDTFTLSYTVASGYTVVYYKDADNDGVLDASELLPIPDTGVMTAGQEVNLIARVCVPDGTSAGDVNVTFTATSTNDTSRFSSQLDKISVQTIRSVTIEPSRGGIGIPGGTVTFRHRVKNTGTLSDAFDLTLTNSLQGWATRFENTSGTAITQTGTLAPGGSEEIVVVRFIPQNEPVNTVEQFEVLVTGTVVNAVAIPTARVLDTISVINGNLDLLKTVTNQTTPGNGQNGKPGEIMVYTVTYRNLGNAALSDVILFDAVPAFTKYVGATVSPSSNASFSTDNGATYGTVGTEPGTPTNATNIKWSIGALAAGASGSVSFKVTIQ